MKKSLAGAFLFVMLLVGCATIGNHYDHSARSNLEPGVTTETQAIALLGGEPIGRVTETDGSYTLFWQYGRHTFLIGGSGTTLTILFDKNGVMVRIVTEGEAN